MNILRIAALAAVTSVFIVHAGEAGRFPFAPAVDDFNDTVLLDLRSLNEKAAGEHGWVRSDGKGGFVRGDGRPLRFWAVGSFVLGEHIGGSGNFDYRMRRAPGLDERFDTPANLNRDAASHRDSKKGMCCGFASNPITSISLSGSPAQRQDERMSGC